MQGENPKITILKRELWILTTRRSLRPSMEENARMWAIMAELYQLTNDESYNLKPK
jgi:hypothetical protein